MDFSGIGSATENGSPKRFRAARLFDNQVCLLPNLLAGGPRLTEAFSFYLQEHTGSVCTIEMNEGRIDCAHSSC